MVEENKLHNLGDIVIFNTEDGDVRVQVDAVNETIWLNQKGLSELFGVGVPAINKHLKNIFAESELSEDVVVSKMEITTDHGALEGRTQSRQVNFYNLDAIIAVGYRINSKRATSFRIWATTVLREYMVKGFALDDERMKRGNGISHFRELLDRIREIRISEKVFYQQIKDIYKLSEDYDPRDEKTINFFKKVQNKLLWAVSKQTAAELIYYRANASLPQMGLTSTQVQGLVKSTDILVGKNYLNEDELNTLKLIVEQYLAFAETQARAHQRMFQKDWIEALDMILRMNRKELLSGNGHISKELAERKAREAYAEYKTEQRRAEKIESLKELERDLREYNTPKL